MRTHKICVGDHRLIESGVIIVGTSYMYPQHMFWLSRTYGGWSQYPRDFLCNIMFNFIEILLHWLYDCVQPLFHWWGSETPCRSSTYMYLQTWTALELRARFRLRRFLSCSSSFLVCRCLQMCCFDLSSLAHRPFYNILLVPRERWCSEPE